MKPKAQVEGRRPIGNGEFVGLLLKHERRLRAFLMTVLPSAADIDDLVQEVSLLAWEKLSEFQVDNQSVDEQFVSWICSIGKFKAFNSLRKSSRSRLIFSDELVEQLAEIQLEQASHFESRHEALMSCVVKLSVDEREMLRRRYCASEPVGEIAVWMERSTDSIYKAMNRIRTKLMRCIELTLRLEGTR